jgi:flavorubredoxin
MYQQNKSAARLNMKNNGKSILIIYHSQSGTMAKMAECLAAGAHNEQTVEVICKKAGEATVDDLLRCNAIAIGSPEYFGVMAGMVKDFFDRTFQIAKDHTIGLPYVVFVCAGNDGRGTIAQIDHLATGYKWRKAQEHLRIIGEPTQEDLTRLEELGQTLAAGVDYGIL